MPTALLFTPEKKNQQKNNCMLKHFTPLFLTYFILLFNFILFYTSVVVLIVLCIGV